MSRKIIGKGDIVRIRHNTSDHFFKENELVVVKETYPLYEDDPEYLKCANRETHWMVNMEDVTLFERNPHPDDDE
jgi:hypothetical protein